jgi:hypothetical protein
MPSRTRKPAAPSPSNAPPLVNGPAFKKLARARAPRVPPRLLARLDQFATMAKWTLLSTVEVKSVWQPPARFVVVEGDLNAGKLVAGDGVSDLGIVVVLGDVTCASLEVTRGWTFVCTGNVTAKGTIHAFAGDSATYVGGKVCAKLVKSGRGAWLTLFGGRTSLDASISHYVMLDGVGPLKKS